MAWKLTTTALRFTAGDRMAITVSRKAPIISRHIFCWSTDADICAAGDTIVAATTNNPLLAAYAARHQNGLIALLAINKDPLNTITGKVALAGYVPSASALLYTCGIPQDDAARTGVGSPDLARTNFVGAATNFSFTFPPYSATVFTFPPAAVKLVAARVAANPGRLIFQWQGQPGVPGILQTSTNLANWISVSTKVPLTGALNFTNELSPLSPCQFWRSVWQP